MRRLSGWLILASVAIAAVAFWWGPLRWFIYAGPNDVPNDWEMARSVWLGWLWMASFAAALIVDRRRWLWLFLVATFALYWPVMWIFVGRACDLLGRCG